MFFFYSILYYIYVCTYLLNEALSMTLAERRVCSVLVEGRVRVKHRAELGSHSQHVRMRWERLKEPARSHTSTTFRPSVSCEARRESKRVADAQSSGNSVIEVQFVNCSCSVAVGR